jgi:membrane-associated phospholipid phosphatase
MRATASGRSSPGICIFALLMLATTRCGAQSGASARDANAIAVPVPYELGDAGAEHAWSVILGGLALTALTDERLSTFARTHQRSALDQVARAVDPFGRAGVLVPALAASVALPRLVGRRNLSDAALRVALSYVVADGIEGVLKPLVGRHRPSDAGGAWRFRSLSNDANWHSLPSAHTVHAFALATGLALEARTPWVAVPAYGLATLVGLQRVYTGAHWSSDIVGSAVLAVVVVRATERTLRRRRGRHGAAPLNPPPPAQNQ